MPPGGPGPGGQPPGEAKSGKGAKIAIIVLVVAILVGLGIGTVVLLTGGDDDKVVAAKPSTTTTEKDAEDESTTTTKRTPRTLVERTTTTEDDTPATTTDEMSGDLESALGYDLDPATLECTMSGVLSDPALADATASGDLEPTSPEFASLLDVLVGCGARTQIEDAFVEGMSQGGLDQASIDCVVTQLSLLSDLDFTSTIVGFATEDPASLELISGCIPG